MRVSGMDLFVVNPERPAQGVRDLKEAGFRNIILYVGALFPKEGETERERQRRRRYGPDTIAARYRDYLEECGKAGMKVALVHAPCVSIEAEGQGCSEMLSVTAEECMKLCRSAGCRGLIMEPPYRKADGDLDYDRNHDYYLEIAPLANRYGVLILVKNQLRDIGGHIVRSALSEPSFAADWVDRLNREARLSRGAGMNEEVRDEVFGFCLDTGRCSLCGNNMQAFVTSLGHRLKAVILSDNDGRDYGSMLPFTHPHEGQTLMHWLGLVRGLREIEFDGELAVEFAGTISSFSILLWPTLLRLAREVGDYFRWQIGMESGLKKCKKIVLFGAGNMCRNYMKCYGGQYPPLFICDNNESLWGTDFEGLEVRNPEELRALPEDCTVIICNIYYREIEAQLRKLGVEKIGYFNDEYMPSFYFDRLVRESE